MRRLRARPSTLVIVAIFLGALALYILFRPAPIGTSNNTSGGSQTTVTTERPTSDAIAGNDPI